MCAGDDRYDLIQPAVMNKDELSRFLLFIIRNLLSLLLPHIFAFKYAARRLHLYGQ